MKKPFVLASLPHGRWYHLCECPWALELSKEWLISETVGRIWTSKLWCPHRQLMVGWRCKGCPELISCCGFLQDARMTMFSTFWDGLASCLQVDASSPKSSLLPLFFFFLFIQAEFITFPPKLQSFLKLFPSTFHSTRFYLFVFFFHLRLGVL